jgi:hypothetical protein
VEAVDGIVSDVLEHMFEISSAMKRPLGAEFA